MRFLYPPEIAESVCPCVCLYVNVRVGGRKRRGEVGTESKMWFPVYCWQMFVSAHPHINHRNHPAEDQRMEWISLSRGCPYHVVHRISTRTPEPSCPGPSHTNTQCVFQLPIPLTGPEKGLRGLGVGKQLYSRTKPRVKTQSVFCPWVAAGKPRTCVQEYWKVRKAARSCEEMVSASCQIPLTLG